MSLPKKKSRIISMESGDYRWITSRNDYGIDIHVELTENPVQLLHAIAKYQYSDSGKQISVSSAQIRSIVESALMSGWEPLENKPKFTSKEEVGLI